MPKILHLKNRLQVKYKLKVNLINNFISKLNNYISISQTNIP